MKYTTCYECATRIDQTEDVYVFLDELFCSAECVQESVERYHMKVRPLEIHECELEDDEE
jgi:hypothetical protein